MLQNHANQSRAERGRLLAGSETQTANGGDCLNQMKQIRASHWPVRKGNRPMGRCRPKETNGPMGRCRPKETNETKETKETERISPHVLRRFAPNVLCYVLCHCYFWTLSLNQSRKKQGITPIYIKYILFHSKSVKSLYANLLCIFPFFFFLPMAMGHATLLCIVPIFLLSYGPTAAATLVLKPGENCSGRDSGPLGSQFIRLSLLGLLAKIKCSICSYQFDN